MSCEFPGCTNSTGIAAYCTECRERTHPHIEHGEVIETRWRRFKRKFL